MRGRDKDWDLKYILCLSYYGNMSLGFETLGPLGFKTNPTIFIFPFWVF